MSFAIPSPAIQRKSNLLPGDNHFGKAIIIISSTFNNLFVNQARELGLTDQVPEMIPVAIQHIVTGCSEPPAPEFCGMYFAYDQL